MFKKAFIIFFGSLLIVSVSHLSATVLTFYDVGSKAATMAGAFVGRADNTAAIFYNPAGLAFQKSLGFRINVIYHNYSIEGGSQEAPPSKMNSKPQLMGPIFLAYTYKERISIGVGAFAPYHLETRWPFQWPGDPLCVNSELKVFTIRPALAVKINNYLSVGAGLDIVSASVNWEFHNIHSVFPGLMGLEWIMNKLKTSGNGTGFTVGVLFKPTDKFQVGGKYQKKLDLDLEGDNTYGHRNYASYQGTAPEYNSGVDPTKPEFFNHQRAVFSLPLPSEAAIGFLLTPAKRFTFQTDIQRTFWSSFKKWEFVAADPEASFFPEDLESEETDVEHTDGAREGIELNMKDTWSFKVGGEYFLKDELSLRFGYARHLSPIDDKNLTPVLPILPRNVFSLGLGYDGPARSITDQSLIGNLTFDAFIQYVMHEERTSSYPGYPLTFGGNYWVFGVGVGLYL